MEDKKVLIGFAGFGGPEIALRELGIKQVVGIELDNDIAEVNRLNGGNCLTADILDVDPANYANYWLYHFSPQCPGFSIARSRKTRQNVYQRVSDLARFQRLLNSEGEIDLQHSRKICQFIKVGRPEFFTLENVWACRKSLSFSNIYYMLLQEGYSVDWWHLNAADYGVPQTRKRMIVVARRDGRRPAKPWQTHSKKADDWFTQPWIGWYDGIKDLIDSNDLPVSEFAPWQLKKLPDKLKTVMVNSRNANRPLSIREKNEPSITVTASDFRRHSGVPKVFIVNSANDNFGGCITVRDSVSAMFTVTSHPSRLSTRVFLTGTGKVVSMTPRCLARFQDFPDWFVLPKNKKLACQGVGNALPPGLYRAVLKTLVSE